MGHSERIHIGHVRNYTLGEVIARYMWARGYKVLHRLGWGAEGLRWARRGTRTQTICRSRAERTLPPRQRELVRRRVQKAIRILARSAKSRICSSNALVSQMRARCAVSS